MNSDLKTNPVEKTTTASAANKSKRPTPPASSESDISLVGGVRLSKWRRQVGVSRTTVWRWRKSGRLPVVMRYNVAFLSAETVKNFFADDNKQPARRNAGDSKGKVQQPK